MARIVVKFGGSVLRCGEDYRRAAKRVVKLLEERNEVVVVVSAMRGVTDQLAKLLEPRSDWSNIISYIHDLHVKTAREALEGRLLSDALRRIDDVLSELSKIVHAVQTIGDVTPRLRDYVLSFGERLSTTLMWSVLASHGVSSVSLTGREAGIITNDSFGEAEPIMDITRRMTRETLIPLLKKGVVPVVSGFIGGTLSGDVTTLGRGGGDYTATLLASTLEASRVILYTDVPGILTGDPSTMQNVRLVPQLSYDEAIECAVLGAKRLHPRTFEPIRDANVEVLITCMDCDQGTIVRSENTGPPAKVVTARKDLAMIMLHPHEDDDLSTTLNMVLNALQRRLSAHVLVQHSPVQLITILVERGHVSRLVSSLEELAKHKLIRSFSVSEKLGMLSVIGYGVKDIDVICHLLEGESVRAHGMFFGSASVSVLMPADKVDRVAASVHERMIRRWWS